VERTSAFVIAHGGWLHEITVVTSVAMKHLPVLTAVWGKNKLLIALLAAAVFIKLFSLFPGAVETYYSHGIYRVTAAVQRILLGWIPISMGDLLYIGLPLFLVYKLFRLIRRLIKKQQTRQHWIDGLRWCATMVLGAYVLFYGLWGLNYNRKGIDHELGITVGRYTKDELLVVVQTVVERLQELESTARVDRAARHTKALLFQGAIDSYKRLALEPYGMSYSLPSIKPVLSSHLCNWLGYPGYYNPISGEAQVNTAIPVFAQPLVICHEMSHQLGYAGENEANFIGYLAAKSSEDSAFRYSAYVRLYGYAIRNLRRLDPALAAEFSKKVPAGVKQDWEEEGKFWSWYANKVEVAKDRVYDKFLKANQQPAGILSYDEVVAWVIAYQRKYGKDAI